MNLVTLTFISLAVFRIWRLIGRDDITAGIREAIGGTKVGDWALKGISCPWCLGSWLSIAACWLYDTGIDRLEPNWYIWTAAVATLVGLLGEIDGKLSD